MILFRDSESHRTAPSHLLQVLITKKLSKLHLLAVQFIPNNPNMCHISIDGIIKTNSLLIITIINFFLR